MQRTDAYARQRTHSRLYYHVKQPLTDTVLKAHLTGEVTVGLHAIEQNGTSRWSVIDSDDGLWPVFDAQQQLKTKGITSYVEASRAGGHLWVWWQEPQDPRYLRKILSPYARGRELFPAGDIPDEDGYGLVLRAPLGIHQATMQRYPFLNEQAAPLVADSAVRGQLAWLREHVVKNDPELLGSKETFAHQEQLRARGIVFESPIRAWNDRQDIASVIGQYVPLSRNGLAHCPWGENHNHGDQHRSLKVFESTNRWWCFSERIGGRAADFVMRYEHLTPHDFYERYCTAEMRSGASEPKP